MLALAMIRYYAFTMQLCFVEFLPNFSENVVHLLEPFVYSLETRSHPYRQGYDRTLNSFYFGFEGLYLGCDRIVRLWWIGRVRSMAARQEMGTDFTP